MNLRLTAQEDIQSIIEDTETGFGWPITVTDPDGNIGIMAGLSDDISQIIDPDTGQAVSGRLASITLMISSLTAAGFGIPQSIADSAKKPWVIEFDDINLNDFKFKVKESNPDRAVGQVTCILELYQ